MTLMTYETLDLQIHYKLKIKIGQYPNSVHITLKFLSARLIVLANVWMVSQDRPFQVMSGDSSTNHCTLSLQPHWVSS